MGSRKKQEDKNLKVLRELVTQPQNKKCFDCGQRGPTYVNMTIGAFVCTSCSGFLRGLNPPHRIKSISMASFNSQDIEFLQSHGNEVCRSTWLALWESPLPAEPESKEEQKVKDFLGRKYERKVWYSSRPKPKPQSSEPEVKPLKTLLGENSPAVIIGSKQEPQSMSIRPPQASIVKDPTPTPQPKEEKKSNMDLLGDLGGNFFASSAQTSSQSQGADVFGMYAQPPSAMNQPQQQQQAPLFDAFGSNNFNSTSQQQQQQTSTSNNLDFFSSSSNAQSSAGTDFFAMSSSSSVATTFPTSSAAGSSADKYAAFADLSSTSSTSIFDTQSSIFGNNQSSGFGSSTDSSVFTSNTSNPSTATNIFSSQYQQSSAVPPAQQQQNPFAMSSQTQQKPMNPFQSANTASGWGNTMPAASTNNTPFSSGNSGWGGTQPNLTQQPFSSALNSSSMFPNQLNTHPVASQHFSMQQQAPNSVYSTNPNYTQQPNGQQISQNNFPQQQVNMFGNQQQLPQNGFSQHQPQQPQQTFGGGFGGLTTGASSALAQKPFGGIQMPGFGQFPQQSQPAKPFGTWQAQPTNQQQQPMKSNNPFM